MQDVAGCPRDRSRETLMSNLIYTFGQNPDIDIASTPEDVWFGSGAYPFPAAAAETRAVSTHNEDDGAPGGLGARKIRVDGLDTNGAPIIEDVNLNGTSSVVLTNEFLRVNKAEVIRAGNSETNVGEVSVLIGGVVVGAIQAGLGSTQEGVFSVASEGKGIHDIHMMRFQASFVGGNSNLEIVFQIRNRDNGENAWHALDSLLLDNNSPQITHVYDGDGVRIPLGSDCRTRVISSTANNIGISSFFTLAEE